MARKSLFPPSRLSDALIIAETIWEQNAGNPMRRLTIFDVLDRSPESSTSRGLITASSAYGLTLGSYKADTISLTKRGKAIVERNDEKEMIDAVLGIDIFKLFFDRYVNSAIPAEAAAIDFLETNGIPQKNTKTCLKMLLENGEKVGLIQELSGTKRIVSSDFALEQVSGVVETGETPDNSTATQKTKAPSAAVDPPDTSDKMFFPNLHIDVQIHISPDTPIEQIDQIFKSMADHLAPLRTK